MKKKITKRKVKENSDSGVKSVMVDNNRFTKIDSIDNLWGIKSYKYKDNNLADYENRLSTMSNYELEVHAFELEVSIDLDRETCINQLVRLFKAHLLSQKRTSNNIIVISSDTNDKINDIFGGKL